MVAKAGSTGMQDIILTRVNALVSEMQEAESIANANVDGLIDNAAKNDEGYAAVLEMQEAYVNALTALREKVRETVDIPSEQDQENAKKDMVEIRKKMRDLHGAIPTILEMSIEDLELPEAFTSAVSKGTKAKGANSGIRRPRIDSAYLADKDGNSLKSWESDVTITKVAEFLEIENAALMIHVPEDLKAHDKVEFHISPDSGAYKGKQIFVTLIPRK